MVKVSNFEGAKLLDERTQMYQNTNNNIKYFIPVL